MRAYPPTALVAAILLLGLGCAKSDAAWVAELDSPDPFVRALAAIALSEQAPARARDALPVLLETIDRTELGLQAQAATVLNKLAPRAVDGLLSELLTNEFMTGERRQAVLSALLNAGGAAVPGVLGVLTSASGTTADELSLLLVQIGAPAAPPLGELVRSAEDRALRRRAAALLGSMGADAGAALPALQAASSSTDPELARAARASAARIEAALRASSVDAYGRRGR